MTLLVAQGPEKHQRWRRRLPPDGVVRVGRAAGVWATPWDEHISRAHVQLSWEDGSLVVRRFENARNPVFYQGQSAEQFHLQPGEHFVIGATTFTRSEEEASIDPESRELVTEASFSPQVLRRLRFRPSDQRIQVLSRLPQIIAEVADDAELFVQLINLVLLGVPGASSAAVVECRGQSGQEELAVLHWDRHAILSSPFQASETLIRRALTTGEGVIHTWRGTTGASDLTVTMVHGSDWAMAVPIPHGGGTTRVIYVDGRVPPNSDSTSASTSLDLRDDLKFTELVAQTLGNLLHVRSLQRSQATLGQFFSPVVMQAIDEHSAETVLQPRQANVSVLFSDLRGFTRTSEQAGDDLFGLLDRVSRALGVTTQHVLERGGVIGDMHGDSAMGFWGWPLEQDDAALRACLTALAIRRDVRQAAQHPAHPLHQFRLGVGIASGPAVAGKIGTADLVKVTVFGPVVNLAARLEGLTGLLHTPILIDEVTAAQVSAQLQADQGRVRRLGLVRPSGSENAVRLFEVLPPASEEGSLDEEAVAKFEAAVDAFTTGDWHHAYRLLHEVPASDRAKDYLTLFMVQNDRTPPPDWDGVVKFGKKST